MTALDYACKYGHHEIEQLLVRSEISLTQSWYLEVQFNLALCLLHHEYFQCLGGIKIGTIIFNVLKCWVQAHLDIFYVHTCTCLCVEVSLLY